MRLASLSSLHKKLQSSSNKIDKGWRRYGIQNEKASTLGGPVWADIEGFIGMFGRFVMPAGSGTKEFVGIFWKGIGEFLVQSQHG